MTKLSPHLLERNRSLAQHYIELHATGLTWVTIAKAAGITRDALYKFIQKYGDK